jgi:uncharacterized protein YuzE
MKIVYDPDADMLQISFSAHAVEETTQIAPGFILDYDEDGRVVGLELRKASQRMDNPYTVNYLVGQANREKPQPVSRDQ